MLRVISKIIGNYKIGTFLDDLSNDASLNAVIEIEESLKNYSRNEMFDKIKIYVTVKFRPFSITERIYQKIYKQICFNIYFYSTISLPKPKMPSE